MYKRLSLFVNYLHELKWTTKSSGLYQLMHLSGLLFSWLFSVLFVLKWFGFIALVGSNYERLLVFVLLLFAISFNTWYLFMRKRTIRFYDRAKQADLLIGLVLYVFSWANGLVLLYFA